MIKIIKNGTVITMDEKRNEKYEKLDIVIEDNIIKKVVENYNGEYDEVIDATNKIVMPGLINCHTHLGMSIFRATNDNLNLNDWLTKKIWPIEDNMTDEDIYYTTLLSCIEMIKTGTTMCNDMYFGCSGSLKAIKESKMRCMFSRCLTGDMNEDGINRINEFKKIYIDNKDDELINLAVSEHALYTCSKEYLEEGKKLADELDLPIHIHFSENENEVNGIINSYNCSPVNALNKLGFLDRKLILAHGTFISKEDQLLLKDKDVSVVHNPISNLNLGCGIADITSYKNNNINVCLGTDGQGSGNNMNLFYHMSMVDLLQKGIYKDPTIMSSYDVLKIATINGAKALGKEDEIGSIEEGKKADIIILDLNNIEAYPTVDLITQVVHNTESINVDTTIINGEILMSNHKLKLSIDEENLKKEIGNIIERLAI